MSRATPSRCQKNVGLARMHKLYRLLDVAVSQRKVVERGMGACAEKANSDQILREESRWSVIGVGSSCVAGLTAIQERGRAAARRATRTWRPFRSVTSRSPFQRIEPIRDLAKGGLDIAELAIGLPVDLVIELGALVLVGEGAG